MDKVKDGGTPAEEQTGAPVAEGTPSAQEPTGQEPEAPQGEDRSAVDAAAEREALNQRIAELESITSDKIKEEAERQMREIFPDWSGEDPHAAEAPAGYERPPQAQGYAPPQGDQPGGDYEPDPTERRLSRLERQDYERQVDEMSQLLQSKVERLTQQYPNMDPARVLFNYSSLPDDVRVNEDRFLEHEAKRSHDEMTARYEDYHRRKSDEERSAPQPPPVPTGGSGTPGSARPPATYPEAKKQLVQRLTQAFKGG